MPEVLDRLRSRLRAGVGLIYREIAKFATIGAVAFVIDIGLANLLWHTVLADKVTTARVISGAVGTLFAWVGNRTWTFRHRRSREPLQEVVLFFAINGLALAIGAAILALSHYGLGQQSRLADNIATIVGIGVGTIVRFFAYRFFVFSGAPAPDATALVAKSLGEPIDGTGDTALTPRVRPRGHEPH